MEAKDIVLDGLERIRHVLHRTLAGLTLACLAAPALAQRTKVTIYTSLENDQLGPFKQAIETAIEGLKKANEGQDGAAIQRALDALTAAQHKAAESLYRQTQSSGGGPAGGGPTGSAQEPAGSTAGSRSQGDVIDAEVVDEGKQ